MNTHASPTTLHAPATLGLRSGGGEVGETGAVSATDSGSVPLAIVRLGSAASCVGGSGEATAVAPPECALMRLPMPWLRVPSTTTATAATATISSTTIALRLISKEG